MPRQNPMHLMGGALARPGCSAMQQCRLRYTRQNPMHLCRPPPQRRPAPTMPPSAAPLPNGASRRVNWDGRETWDGQNTGDAAMKQIATARRVRFAAAATQGARRCASAWCR